MPTAGDGCAKVEPAPEIVAEPPLDVVVPCCLNLLELPHALRPTATAGSTRERPIVFLITASLWLVFVTARRALPGA